MHRTILVGIVGASTLALACSGEVGKPDRSRDPAGQGDEATQGGQLEGTVWQLASFAVGDALQSTPAGVYADALFAAGKVSGSSGCNRYTGDCPVSENSLMLGPVAATKKACQPPASEVESAYLAGLAKAATYTATSQALTLFDASGKPVLVFAPSKPVLTGVTWHLAGYNNGKAGVVSTLAGTDLTIHFDADGALAGNAGCNQYSGPYTIKDDTIELGPIAATMMACVRQELTDQEAAYLAALATAATYSVRGSRLELRATDGRLAAHFDQR